MVAALDEQLRAADEELAAQLEGLAAVLEQELDLRSEQARRARKRSREARVYDLVLLARLADRGLTQREIAQAMSRRHRFGISQSTVSRLIRAHLQESS